MISANDLKVQGIKALSNELKDNDEAIISFRGEPKYIVIDFERYDKLRELELDKMYLEVVEDIKQGKSHTSDAQELIQRIESEL